MSKKVPKGFFDSDFKRVTRNLEKALDRSHEEFQQLIQRYGGCTCADFEDSKKLVDTINYMMNTFALSIWYPTSDGDFIKVRLRVVPASSESEAADTGMFHVHRTGKVPVGVSRSTTFPRLIAGRTEEEARKLFERIEGATNAQEKSFSPNPLQRS